MMETMTQEEVLRRWPRLVAHMICESLGYFTPKKAALAIICYKRNEPYFCEWYSAMANARGADFFDDDTVREIGRDVIKRAFERRHMHKGFMADYEHARAVVQAELAGNGPVFASWF